MADGQGDGEAGVKASGSGRSVEAELEPFVRNAPRGTAVDVGFGDGDSLGLLIRLGYGPVYGYEVDPDCVASARRRFGGSETDLHLRTDDAIRMEVVPDGSVDLMIVHNTLQYLPLEPLAATVRHVMRPGGRLVGHVPRPVLPPSPASARVTPRRQTLVAAVLPAQRRAIGHLSCHWSPADAAGGGSRDGLV